MNVLECGKEFDGRWSMILHMMWSGKSLRLLCILPFDILCLSAVRMMFVKIILAVCMLVGTVV